MKLLKLVFISTALIAMHNISYADDFEFALVGDNPYSDATYDNYIRLIDDVNGEEDVQWVVHLGDVKGGGQSCSDEEFQRRFELNQRFQLPFLVTPGDNDWLDCKRESAGGYNEYERLAAFRKLFFATPGYSNGGNPMPVVQQSSLSEGEFSEYVENAMWEREGVVFATVHTVALTVEATDSQQMERRHAAAIDWIESAFARAEETDAKGVFLAMQADPWGIWGLPSILRRTCGSCADPKPALAWLYPVLREQTIAFGKPVVLAVGDTHIFRVDKPLYTDRNQLIENFTRVEVFGNPQVHWVNVLVEPDESWVFSFRQQMVD